MRGVPADVKEPGQHGVVPVRLEQARLVMRMRVALVAGYEPRAHDHGRRAAGECSLDHLATHAEGERHPRNAFLNRDLESLVLLEVEHEVNAERAVRRAP